MLKELFKKMSRAGSDSRLNFGGFKIPADYETTHFLLAGTTGSGKTVALKNMLDVIRDRGDSAIVLDAAGDLMQLYYNKKTDKILAADDERSEKWSPWAELKSKSEIRTLANAIVPDGQGSGAEWNEFAQTVVASILQQIIEKRLDLHTQQILRFAIDAPLKTNPEIIPPRLGLDTLMQGTPAARIFGYGADKMAASIMGIVGAALSSWSLLDPAAGANSFSVRDWVTNAEHNPGFLWLTYRDLSAEFTKPLRRTWLSIAINSVLDLQPKKDRRIWLILDELPAAGFVSGLDSALARGRKYGLCCVAGIQSIAQLKDIYNDNKAQSLLSNFRSVLITAQGDAETAEYFSKQLGQREIERREFTEDDKGKRSAAERIVLENLVLGSELMRLPTLNAYVLLPGSHPIAKVKLEFPRNRAQAAQAFIVKVGDTIDKNIKGSDAQLVQQAAEKKAAKAAEKEAIKAVRAAEKAAGTEIKSDAESRPKKISDAGILEQTSGQEFYKAKKIDESKKFETPAADEIF